MQKVLSYLRHAVDKYNMIDDGDRIAVGVSGGKDSIVLLKALQMYSRFSPKKFEVVGITIDSFGHPEDFDEIKKMCEQDGIEYHVIASDIAKIVFDERQEKNPCSLCAKLRRGTLNTVALSLKCNKLALGHTADDVIDTFMLSMIYEGRLNTMQPVGYMSRTGMILIRPLILLDEHTIEVQARRLPLVSSRCPVNKKTKREYVHNLVERITKEVPIARDRIFGSITSPERYNLFDKTIDLNELKQSPQYIDIMSKNNKTYSSKDDVELPQPKLQIDEQND